MAHQVRYRGREFTLVGDEPAWAKGTFASLKALERVRACSRLGTYVVVGARWGNAPVWLTAYCGVRQLALFEPDPERFLLCRANIQASADARNRRWLTFQFPAGAGGYAAIIDGKVKEVKHHVPTQQSDLVFLAIDHVIPGAVSLLYVAVPEPLRVLRGADKTLRRDRPLIVLQESARQAPTAHLHRLGYRLFDQIDGHSFWSAE